MAERGLILVIDDSELIQRLIMTRVAELGVEVISALDGSVGLEIAESRQPDLILLDIEMPDVSGFEVCAKLKLNPNTVNIPVIFITGLNTSVDKVRGFDLGAVDYVTKPFDPAELKARVRSALKIKNLMDMLASQAQLDGRTGLHNRRYFDQRLGQELASGERYRKPVGLLLVDIDEFKQINDRNGHPKGDQVIKRFAELIQAACRESDTPCRYGGDEFAIILPESDKQQAQNLADRLHQIIRSDAELQAIIDAAITPSIGAACAMPGDDTDASGLLLKADQALYQSKEAGRDRVTIAA